MRKLTEYLVAAVLTLIAGQAIAENNWEVVAAESTISFVVLVAGAETAGSFEDWSAEITFDPKSVDQAEIRVDVEMSSVTIGHPQALALIGSAVWLGVDDFPTAQFIGHGFTNSRGNVFEMPGVLSLKGISRPTKLVGNITFAGDLATASFSTTLSRFAHAIGDANPVISDGVIVTVDLVARRISD